MSKTGIASAIIVAALITAVLVIPNLLAIWIYVTIGFKWEVVLTISLLIFLMCLNYTLRLAEDES